MPRGEQDAGQGHAAVAQLGGPLRSTLLLGLLGAWGGTMLLIVALLVGQRASLAGKWEAQHGVSGFLPAWLLLSAVPGLVSGLIASGSTSQVLRSLVGALAGMAVGWGVSGGRHFAAVPLRVGFVVGVGLVGAGALWAFGRWVVARQVEMGGAKRRLASIGVLLTLAVLGEAANQLALVRLYPAFHLALSFLTLAAPAVCLCLLLGSGQHAGARWGEVAVTLTLLVSGVALKPASEQVRGFDNFRWVVVRASPTLAWGLDLAALVAPPPAVDVLVQEAPLGSWTGARDVSFRDRSILLVTVDALRADHLGAYGYSRPTSPVLDRLAASGVRFDAAYAPTPHTSYSVTSLLTGKYMRPLLLQGAGQDSELLAGLLATYGYKTAGFYPPAVFFIDGERFTRFSGSHLGFEYFKVEFSEGEARLQQIDAFLRAHPADRPFFVWLHLFGPHEPYEDQADWDFGPRDVDRYDEEIAAADRTIGRVVASMTARDPKLVTIVTADHGEEFGEHGGRYHGTTVYEEQVRVPLIVHGDGLARGAVIHQPVQTIDVLPTILSGLSIPVPPRVRGHDLLPQLSPRYEEPAGAEGLALAETDDFVLLAEAAWRLICERRSGACQLYDLSRDPSEKKDASAAQGEVFERLKQRARALAASHGRLEASGLRAEGKGWPDAIVRGISGDAEAAPELARLLEDADAAIRAKSAEVLFALARVSEAPALRLALSREEDSRVRAYLALTLTRLGQGAPLVRELLDGGDPRLRHLAALALAEQGVDDGQGVLLNWWLSDESRTFDEDRQIVQALGRIGSDKAVGPLLQRIDDVRLRPHIADALASIGDKDAAPFLARVLVEERYQSTRPALARALLALGGRTELILPLRHFLGVADPMPGGLELARKARILEDVGGPTERERSRLSQLSSSGVDISVVVPPLAKALPRRGVQLVVRARLKGEGRRILISPATPRIPGRGDEPTFRVQPQISAADALAVQLDEGTDWQEKRVLLPEKFRAQPGFHLGLSVFSEAGVELESLVALPVRDEIPPPAPKPWRESQD